MSKLLYMAVKLRFPSLWGSLPDRLTLLSSDERSFLHPIIIKERLVSLADLFGICFCQEVVAVAM